MASSLPILEAARAGFIHLRETLRESLIPAAITAAAAAGLQVLIWSSPGWVLLLVLASAFVTVPFLAGQYRRALGLSGGSGLRLGGDEARLAGATAAVYFFFVILMVIGGFLVLIASTIGLVASGVDLQSAPQEPQALLAAIGPRGLIVLAVCAAPLIGAMIWISARLVCYGAASIDRQQIMTFSTWSWTKGSALRIVLAAVALGLPLALGANLAQGTAGALLLGPGVSPSDAIARAPLPVAVFAFISNFASLILLAGPMAGQAAFLYRGLCPLERSDSINP